MDLQFIEKLIETVARAPIEELELERDGWRVRIAKAGRAERIGIAPAPLNAEAPPLQATQPQRKPAHMIHASLTGTFYRSATEGGPPLVSVNDRVDEGQPLGILEAMKTFNPIESDWAGRIVEILAGNGQAVQAGDPLFALETG